MRARVLCASLLVASACGDERAESGGLDSTDETSAAGWPCVPELPEPECERDDECEPDSLCIHGWCTPSACGFTELACGDGVRQSSEECDGEPGCEACSLGLASGALELVPASTWNDLLFGERSVRVGSRRGQQLQSDPLISIEQPDHSFVEVVSPEPVLSARYLAAASDEQRATIVAVGSGQSGAFARAFDSDGAQLWEWRDTQLDALTDVVLVDQSSALAIGHTHVADHNSPDYSLVLLRLSQGAADELWPDEIEQGVYPQIAWLTRTDHVVMATHTQDADTAVLRVSRTGEVLWRRTHEGHGEVLLADGEGRVAVMGYVDGPWFWLLDENGQTLAEQRCLGALAGDSIIAGAAAGPAWIAAVSSPSYGRQPYLMWFDEQGVERVWSDTFTGAFEEAPGRIYVEALATHDGELAVVGRRDAAGPSSSFDWRRSLP